MSLTVPEKKMDSKPDKAKVIVRFSPDVILCG